MSKRPYIQLSIIQIERLFAQSEMNHETLEQLLEELEHRKTKRALHLKKRIKAAQKSVEVGQASANHVKATVTPSTKPDTSTSDHTPMQSQSAPFEDYNEQIEADDVKPGSDSVLAAWLAQEVLTPQTLLKARDFSAFGQRLIRLDEEAEPWLNPGYVKKGKERAVYWMVYLAELDLKKMLEDLFHMFPDVRSEETLRSQGKVAAAVLVLDAQGKPVEGRTFLASFPWGCGMVYSRQLSKLATFSYAEEFLLEKLDEMVTVIDEAENVQPLTPQTVDKTVAWLLNMLQLPSEYLISSGVAVRVPSYKRSPEAPEPELLNSFYLNDLRAVRQDNFGLGLQSYLSSKSNKKLCDVYKEPDKLAQKLAPKNVPLSRWPIAGDFSLVMMQQAAVNHISSELPKGGLVAVNGPPGTGKTTLLRDVIAKVVLDRATVMSTFAKPADAFSHAGKMKLGQAFANLYQLDDRLLGHEIVVASSNNKAVENISREIPASDAVTDSLQPPLRYFQSVADVIAAGDGDFIEGATWGLAAAILGNKGNRNRFVDAFWWHKKRGMLAYLKSITGDNPILNLDEKTLPDSLKEMLDVVTLEQPPQSELEAQKRYKKARAEFKAKLEQASKLQYQMQEIYEAAQAEKALNEELDKSTQDLLNLKRRLLEQQAQITEVERTVAVALGKKLQANEDRNIQQALKPNFLSRIFRRKEYLAWRGDFIKAVEAARVTRELAETEQAHLEDLRSVARQSNIALRDMLDPLSKLREKLEQNRKLIEDNRGLLGDNLADNDFWAQPDALKQKSSPWLSKDWQTARAELFTSSFKLHRAFIDASAKFMRHNLSAALEQLKGRVLADKHSSVRRSLWASLFMVVPVVSTTFASMSSLFKSLGREEIGWLLIDEAGQALPQAAVGAIWRAQRAVIIGDPLQIQPVVTTPAKLVDAIHNAYGVEADKWAAPSNSAQSLADRSSWFGTKLETGAGPVWVGSPLRVHRRCDEPMFSISNFIAYDGQMVDGTVSSASQIGQVLGASQWLHSESQSSAKWSSVEGEIARQMLRRLDAAGLENPDIFFITPFRNVAFNLRNTLRATGRDFAWIQDRIGTVHTFQGREAEAVVLVLGAAGKDEFGARNWAGETVNILNVAVTRAKRRIYVIGNRDLWDRAGVFTHLAQNLPIINSDNL